MLENLTTEKRDRLQLQQKLRKLSAWAGKNNENDLQKMINDTLKHSKELPLAEGFPVPEELMKDISGYVNSPDKYSILHMMGSVSKLDEYYANINQSFLNKPFWESPDPLLEPLVDKVTSFSPKTGGAKNAGKRTGVYVFKNDLAEEKILMKQGADPGETIAEYLGHFLYELTIPEFSARCVLARDTASTTPSVNDVYVGSIYAKGDKVQDSFKAVGCNVRNNYTEVKAWFNRVLGRQDKTLREIIKLDERQAKHSLAQAAANVIWHGDHDLNMGNFVLVEKEGQKRFVKIDHGFSFFNFGKKVVDIFNPLAGKIMSVSPKRALKGGQLMQMYPVNRFWDFTVETKTFYYNGPFVKACEDIAQLKEEDIRKKLQKGLSNVRMAYGENALKALKIFAKRIGMSKSQILSNTQKGNVNVEDVCKNIENYMVARLMKRQNSLKDLAGHCRDQIRYLTPERKEISGLVNEKIISLQRN